MWMRTSTRPKPRSAFYEKTWFTRSSSAPSAVFSPRMPRCMSWDQDGPGGRQAFSGPPLAQVAFTFPAVPAAPAGMRGLQVDGPNKGNEQLQLRGLPAWAIHSGLSHFRRPDRKSRRLPGSPLISSPGPLRGPLPGRPRCPKLRTRAPRVREAVHPRQPRPGRPSQFCGSSGRRMRRTSLLKVPTVCTLSTSTPLMNG